MRGYGVTDCASQLFVKNDQDMVPTVKLKMEYDLVAIDEKNVSIIRHELEGVMRQIDNIVFGLYKKSSDGEDSSNG